MSELSDKEILIMMTSKCADLERQLAEEKQLTTNLENQIEYGINKHNTRQSESLKKIKKLKDMLLQVQDHMHQLSSHTSDGWAGASADNVYNMIEKQLKKICE